MKKYTFKNNLQIFIGVILFLTLWEVLALKINNDIYLPNLKEVYISLKDIISSKDFLFIILSTLFRTFISFIIAIIFGVFLGIISSASNLINNLLKPLNLISKTIPTLVLVVLALIWFNKESAPFVVGTLIVFPIVYDGVLNTLRDVDFKTVEMLKIYDVSLKEKILKVYIPSISLYLLKILVPTFSLAFKVVIAGEVHGQPKYGIGAAVQLSKVNFDTGAIFAWIIIIAILSLVFDVINKVLIKRVYIWR
ncbi:MAG: ABC transporter permease [Clostridium sp.]|uniref:ABC transporter permease n=1 Tax=Clostridium chrysemydis TaxID=2665504 RepID=UPI003EE67F38